jgi:glutamine amidotransferase
MIVVVDYGMGNLRSVSKALEHLGAAVKVSNRTEDLEAAEKIVLPGVGAFGDAVVELRKRKLFECLQAQATKKKKIFGICLGLQLFMETSEESPTAQGLGLLPGKVLKFDSLKDKVPHMGWNNVLHQNKHVLLNGLPNESFFYFVHSYYVECIDQKNKIGSCDYAGVSFSAIAGNENLFATQFHPEKSQTAGLTILNNFLRW